MYEEGSFFEQRRRQRNRSIICFFALGVMLLFLFGLSLMTGSVSLAPGEAFSSEILQKIRLPRALMAAILGGALAVSGFLLQTFFANPLAGPYVLGISSASKVTVAIVMIFFIGRFSHVSSLVLVLASFVGALIATGLLLVISRKLTHMASLLVAGIMIGYVCSAVSDFIITFAGEQDIINLHDWSKGSFSGSSLHNAGVAFVICFGALLLTVRLAKDISALRLGEEYAGSVGVDIVFLRRAIIVISALLSGCVTAFAGPVSFVGIAVPVLVRKLFDTSKPAVIVPGAFLGGAVFCLLCDLLARMMFAPVELSISSVTSVLGAPVVIFALVRKHDKF